MLTSINVFSYIKLYILKHGHAHMASVQYQTTFWRALLVLFEVFQPLIIDAVFVNGHGSVSRYSYIQEDFQQILLQRHSISTGVAGTCV